MMFTKRVATLPTLYHNLQMLRQFGHIMQIKLPDLGEGTKEATIKEWFVKEGDAIDEVRLIKSYSP